MQIEVVPQAADEAITIGIAAKNAGVAAFVAFAVLFATAYKRVGADEFVFWPWLKSNRNRWINGVVTIVLFSALSVMVPDLSSLANIFGFNLNAQVPLSLGLGVAVWLSSTTSSNPPKKADQGSV